jgi:hypothetical protein
MTHYEIWQLEKYGNILTPTGVSNEDAERQDPQDNWFDRESEAAEHYNEN